MCDPSASIATTETEANAPLPEELRHIAAASPLPMMIHQNWRVVWFNEEAGRQLRNLAAIPEGAPLIGFDVLTLLPKGTHSASISNRARILNDDIKPDPVLRTFIGVEGRRLEVVGNGRRVMWEGAPALLISWAVLGAVPPSVAETDRYTGNVPVLEQSIRRRENLQDLTAREFEVASLVAEGYSTVNIASLLGVTEATVRTQLKSVYRKTNTHSRAQLTRLVLGT